MPFGGLQSRGNHWIHLIMVAVVQNQFQFDSVADPGAESMKTRTKLGVAARRIVTGLNWNSPDFPENGRGQL